ncbi:hypothetical protein Ciccas_001589 [Cichlidogyrus casuarinus]|uniref:Uncharacterized protein n=1 Tax=Cichlidogyrus casuarinus TaxID=1844966 RepID=A0ABD2QJN6_9PLAT
MDECWLSGEAEKASILLRVLNELLAYQSANIPIIWDAFITQNKEANLESKEFFGRKSYEFNEIFLRYAPRMSVTSLKKSLWV